MIIFLFFLVSFFVSSISLSLIFNTFLDVEILPYYFNAYLFIVFSLSIGLLISRLVFRSAFRNGNIDFSKVLNVFLIQFIFHIVVYGTFVFNTKRSVSVMILENITSASNNGGITKEEIEKIILHEYFDEHHAIDLRLNELENTKSIENINGLYYLTGRGGALSRLMICASNYYGEYELILRSKECFSHE